MTRYWMGAERAGITRPGQFAFASRHGTVGGVCDSSHASNHTAYAWSAPRRPDLWRNNGAALSGQRALPRSPLREHRTTTLLSETRSVSSLPSDRRYEHSTDRHTAVGALADLD